MFLPEIYLLQTLYPRAYFQGTTSTSEGAETNLDVKLCARTHTGAARLDSFPEGGDPSPTRPSSLVGVMTDESPVTRKSWLDGESAYGGQRKLDLSTLARVEIFFAGGRVGGGIGVMENPPSPNP